MTPVEKNYFPALTGIRCIAAYMVFIHHYPRLMGNLAGKFLPDFLNEFYSGVTLFFVLSGFLIANRYAGLSSINFKKYIVNRIARIYPMYFLFTTATFLTIAVANYHFSNNDLLSFLANITFVRGYFHDLKHTGVPQGWSLTVEETFYFLAPLFFFLLRKKKKLLFVLPVLIAGAGLILVNIFKDANLKGFMRSYEFMFNYTFFGRCFEFFIGIGLSFIYKKWADRPRIKGATYIGAINIIICIAALAMIKGDAEYGIKFPAGRLINNFILPLTGIAVFYYGLITEKTFISKILGSDMFVLLGKSSYIFYLIHLGVVATLLKKITGNLVVDFIILNILSILLFKYVEEPLNNFIRKRFAGYEQKK